MDIESIEYLKNKGYNYIDYTNKIIHLKNLKNLKT